MTFPCIDPDHFQVLPDGSIAPQPWMQERLVYAVEAKSKAGNYGVAGGVNKNELLHSLTAVWTNTSPLTQQVYGVVSRGGSRVTLQARSRGFLSLWHGALVGAGTIVPIEVSRMGVGADVGKGGLLAVGTGFCLVTNRQNSLSMPLMPAQVGAWDVAPGATFNAKVELRFGSEYWEAGSVDGGSNGMESSYVSGDTRLDLFATPVIT